MKVTPLILFILILFVLVLSIIFSKYLPLYEWTEGFVTFSNNKKPIDFVLINEYSKSSQSVVKLYDNLFFDTINGNIIEIDGPPVRASTDRTVTDSSGSIVNMYVTTRDGKTAPVYKHSDYNDKDAKESKVTDISNKIDQWEYFTRTTTTDSYQLLYFSWDKDTFIHIIKLGTTPSHIASFHFAPSYVMDMYAYPNTLSITVGESTSQTNSNRDPLVRDPQYNSTKRVYTINNHTRFDVQNGNLITDISATSVDPSSNIIVHNRYGDIINDYSTNLQTNISNTEFNPFIVNDLDNNMILYMPSLTNSLVSVIQFKNSKFSLGNAVRFNKYGPVLEEKKERKNDIAGDRVNEPSDKGPNSDYYKWLAYWNTIVDNPPKTFSDDYLLKTQIVPPVCPTCPSCPSSSGNVCNNCGGQGGCGTKTNIGESIVKGGQGVQGGQTLSGNLVSGAENITSTGAGVINNTVDTAGALIAGGGVGAGLLAAGAGQEAGHLLTSAGSGTVDLLKSTGGGAVDLLKSTGSGAANLLTNTGSGAVNLLNNQGQRQTQQGYNQGYNQGYGQNYNQGYGQAGGQASGQAGGQVGGVPGVDMYSYYGALPPKQSNFLPVTTNFAAFSK